MNYSPKNNYFTKQLQNKKKIGSLYFFDGMQLEAINSFDGLEKGKEMLQKQDITPSNKSFFTESFGELNIKSQNDFKKYEKDLTSPQEGKLLKN